MSVPNALTTSSWTTNSDTSAKYFEYYPSHSDNDPTNHVYIYQGVFRDGSGNITFGGAGLFTIQFKNDSTHGLGWYDHNTQYQPINVPSTGLGNGSTLSLEWDNTTNGWVVNNNSFFTNYSVGPTVTSITATKIFVPSDTVSNTDFTLLKNGSAYANTNISLTGPGPQPPSDARGYTYSLTYDGTAWYNTTIDSKTYDDFYYDNSWTSSASSYTGRTTNSNRILNVLGSIPSATIMTWTGSTSLTKDTSASSDKDIRWYSSTGGASGTDRNSNYGMYVTGQGLNIVAIFYHYSQGFGSNITYSSPFTVGAQATMSYTAAGNTVYVQDWVYSAEPEGDGYVAPVSTPSNGGGKPDRYPLIMTNLFNRNRSLYSIGMTHKDTWDLFL